MVLSNDIAALIGFACESTLWGAYSILFALSLTLLYRRGRKDVNVVVVVIHCLLFGACTAHYALEFNHFYTVLQATGVQGFADETKPLVGADLLISVADLLGDAVLIYRCWVMWRGNYWVVAVPVLASLAGFGCLGQVAHFIVTQSPTSPVPPTVLVPLTVAGYALPLCTNVIATGLLVFKIWQMARGTVPASHTLRRTVRLANNVSAVIVESGLIYLAAQLIFVVLVTIEHPAEAIIGVMAVPIYGIASTLIIIRVTLGISAGTTTQEAERVSQLMWAASSGVPTAEFSGGAARAGSSGIGGSTTRVFGEDLDGDCFELKSGCESGENVHPLGKSTV